MVFVSVPNSGQSLGATRDQIRNNIQSLKDSLAVNHVNLDLANVGKHKYVQMPSQVTTDPATAADEIAIYVRTDPNVRLSLRQPSSGTVIQLSGIDPLAANIGYTYLPGGLLMQWGRKNMSLNSSTSITFVGEGGVDFDATPYSIQVTATSGSSSDRNVAMFNAASSTGLTLRLNSNTSGNADVQWLVIGPKA